MKKILVFLMALVISLSILAQDADLDRNVFHEVYKKYKDHHTTLEKFHKQFFNGNIFSEIAPEQEVYPLLFDSYGSNYPNLQLFAHLEDKHFECRAHKKYYLEDYSMFRLFECAGNYESLAKGIAELSDPIEKDFYGKLLNDFTKADDNKFDTSGIVRTGGLLVKQQEFYKQWDDFHLRQAETFKKKIAKYDRVLFYVHGYNNPYSFAAIQSLEVLEKAKSLLPKEEKVLLVPVMWRSFDNKKVKIKKGKYFDKNTEGINTLRKFNRHFNGAYLTGVKLRRILNSIESESETMPLINFYTHSSGTTLIAATFINSVKKLDTGHISYNLTNNSCSEKQPTVIFSDPTRIEKYRNDNFVNYELFKLYDSIPIPTKGKYRIFMSAASMPGQATFKELCKKPKGNLVFYSVRNPYDYDLGKKFIKSARFLSDTHLGLDENNDAILTKQICLKKDVPFFISERLEGQEKHSILNYINNKEVLDFLSDFLKGEDSE